MLLRLIELFGATGVVVAEPALGVLRNGSSYLVRFRLNRVEFLLSVLLITLVPAVGLWVGEELLAIAPDAQRVVHCTVLGLLSGVLVSNIAKQRKAGARRALTTGLVAGVAIAAILNVLPVAAHVFVAVALVPLVAATHFVTSLIGRVTRSRGKAIVANVDPATSCPRIVMVIFDEMPLTSLLDGNGRIDEELFPNFARLARESTWYRNTSTIANSTRRAVTTILKGSFVTEGTYPTVRDHPRNMFTLLDPVYDINAHETLTLLSPVKPRDGLPSGPRSLLRETARLWWGYTNVRRRASRWFGDQYLFADTMALCDNFIESLEPSSRPRFDFFHALMPHRPWHYAGTGQDFGDSTSGWTGAGWDERPAHDAAYQRLTVQVQATDVVLGRIIARLEALGVYEECTLAITSDHGLSVSEAGVRSPTPETYPDVLWVPFFVKAPGSNAGVVDDTRLRSIAVMPIVLAAAGITVPWENDGEPGRELADEVGLMAFFTDERTPEAMRTALRKPFDAASGFARVLASNVLPSAAPAAYRLYGAGPHRELAGRLFADLEHGPGVVAGGLDDPARFDAVADCTARRAPWLAVKGTVEERGTDSVAIVVNGVVASVTEMQPAGPERSSFFAIASPAPFAPGHNDVQAYVIRGSARSPVLVLVGRPVPARAQSPSTIA
jgi:Sulfatase